MKKLSERQSKIHASAVERAKIYGKMERALVESLIEVEDAKIHKLLEHRSLFEYAVKELSLERSVALALITVARKAKAIPELRQAVASGLVSPSKASRVASTITSANAKELIQFASTHTTKEIDFEMAKRNPKAVKPDRVKPISEEFVEITVTISKQAYENLQRAQAVLAQKQQPASLGNAVEASAENFLNTQDPVRKAKRAQAKKLCLNRVTVKNGSQKPMRSHQRTPLTADQEHTVRARDEGRCTFTKNGQRCNHDRWVHIHHIRPMANGGTNDPENLTTLCSFHHTQIHRHQGADFKTL